MIVEDEVPYFLEVDAFFVSDFLRCCTKNVGFKFNLIHLSVMDHRSVLKLES